MVNSSEFVSEFGYVGPLSASHYNIIICKKVFRTFFLKTHSVGIMPRWVYRMGDRWSVEFFQWLVYIGRKQNNVPHPGKRREVRLVSVLNVKVVPYCAETNEVFGYIGCFSHWCLCMPDGLKPIGKTKEILQIKYEGTKASLQKIVYAGNKVVSIW